MTQYRPYLIARVNATVDSEAKRLAAIADYDYMGSSEFEFGSCGLSMSRMRLSALRGLLQDDKSEALIIQTAPEKYGLVANAGAYKGKNVHVLASAKTFELYGDSLWQRLRELADRKCRCKEWTAFDHSFRTEPDLFGDMRFDAWHDIDHQLFFSFSDPYLQAIRAMLSMSLDVLNKLDFAKFFSIGDMVQAVEPKAGFDKSKHNPSVENWRVVEGKVAGISDTHLTLKNHGKTYRIPWCLVLTYPALMPKPEINDDLVKAARSKY